MAEKTKLAAIGEKNVMLIFKAMGVDVFPSSAPQEAEGWIRKLAKQGYGIIFITEEIAARLDPVIREYSYEFSPSIVVIPGLKERNNYAIRRLRQAIIKAVGADVIGGEVSE
ncbi:MAG: V-type ATP synthase subunit F [Actinobacteria bacterium]|nr:V-type ATP synthase subunit F [Actinomycetota bacterium]